MTNKKLAIYLHIPFCAYKCNYCDFLSAPAGVSLQMEYIQAMCREIEAYKPSEVLGAAKGNWNQYEEDTFAVSSIFFGGGTPSLPPASGILQIIQTLKKKFTILSDAEITIECNPGTLNKEKLEIYKQAGINRLSLGLQSANEEELKKLGRIHTLNQFLKNWKLAKELGFSNMSVDIMSGLPGQTRSSYQNTLETVLKLKPEHISAYGLIIEQGTPFYELYSAGVGLPSEELDRNMYHDTKQFLKEQGYERYEISNYALPGKESRHNLCYWNGQDYIGFGIGASSYVRGIRYKNTDELLLYLKQSGQPSMLWQEIQVLSKKEKMEEFMFLGLRCQKGVSEREFQNRFECDYRSIYGIITERFEKLGLLNWEQGQIYLTDQGIDVSNAILAEFLIEE